MYDTSTPLGILFDLFGQWQEAEILSLLEEDNGFDQLDDKPAAAGRIYRIVQEAKVGARGYRESGTHAGRWVTFSAYYTAEQIAKVFASEGIEYELPKKGKTTVISYPNWRNLLATIDWTDSKSDSDPKKRLYLMQQSQAGKP